MRQKRLPLPHCLIDPFPPPPVLLVGIGRPGCGDDALGLLAAEALAERLAGELRVVVDGNGGWDALQSLANEGLLVLIDAAQANAHLPAGRWMRLRYPEDAAALGACRVHGTHTASISALLEMAAALDCLPRETWIYALAGERFAPESALSPAVAASLPRLVTRFEDDLQHWRGQSAWRSAAAYPLA